MTPKNKKDQEERNDFLFFFDEKSFVSSLRLVVPAKTAF